MIQEIQGTKNSKTQYFNGFEIHDFIKPKSLMHKDAMDHRKSIKSKETLWKGKSNITVCPSVSPTSQYIMENYKAAAAAGPF